MATNNEAQLGSIAVNLPTAGSNGNTAAGNSGSGPGASTVSGANGSGTISAGSTTATTGLLPTLANLAKGVAGYLPAGSSLTVDGQSLQQSQILTTLNGYIASGNAVSPLRAQWRAASAAWSAEKSDARTYATELKGALIQSLGKQSPLLGEFGISPPKKPAKLTGQKLVAKTAKSNATRALRGTKGTRQKAEIQYTGTVQITAATQSQAQSGASPTAPPGGTTAPAAVKPPT